MSFIWSVLIRHRRYKRYKYRFLRNMVFYDHECSHEIRCGADLYKRSHNGITDEFQRHDNGIIDEFQRHDNGFSTASQRLRHTSSTDYKRMVFAWLSMWSVWLLLTRVCVRGRDKCLLLPLFSGLLVRYEWKFDGGTTVPPFASEIIYDSIRDF